MCTELWGRQLVVLVEGVSWHVLPARISRIYNIPDALARDERDGVVLQAITNVTDRREMSTNRTQVIYDEIRRLDQARVKRTSALAERNANNARNQTA